MNQQPQTVLLGLPDYDRQRFAEVNSLLSMNLIFNRHGNPEHALTSAVEIVPGSLVYLEGAQLNEAGYRLVSAISIIGLKALGGSKDYPAGYGSLWCSRSAAGSRPNSFNI